MKLSPKHVLVFGLPLALGAFSGCGQNANVTAGRNASNIHQASTPSSTSVAPAPAAVSTDPQLVVSNTPPAQDPNAFPQLVVTETTPVVTAAPAPAPVAAPAPAPVTPPTTPSDAGTAPAPMTVAAAPVPAEENPAAHQAPVVVTTTDKDTDKDNDGDDDDADSIPRNIPTGPTSPTGSNSPSGNMSDGGVPAAPQDLANATPTDGGALSCTPPDAGTSPTPAVACPPTTTTIIVPPAIVNPPAQTTIIEVTPITHFTASVDAHPLTPSQMVGTVLPYGKGNQKINQYQLGDKIHSVKTNGTSVPYVSNSQIVFGFDLKDLPASYKVAKINKLELEISYVKVSRDRTPETEILCFMDARICSGHLFEARSWLKNINPKFFNKDSYDAPVNSYFDVKERDVVATQSVKGTVWQNEKLILPIDELLNNANLHGASALDFLRDYSAQHDGVLRMVVADDTYVRSAKLNIDLDIDNQRSASQGK